MAAPDAPGHTALFGVYGLLGIGLMLFCLKGLAPHRIWKMPVLAVAFWSINVGLTLMVLLSLLPTGAQAVHRRPLGGPARGVQLEVE